jgi:hypothetical protein
LQVDLAALGHVLAERAGGSDGELLAAA